MVDELRYDEEGKARVQAALETALIPVTPDNAKEQIERRISDLVELLGAFPEMKGQIDPRAWVHLLVYSPFKLRWVDFNAEDKTTWPQVLGTYAAMIRGDSEHIDGHCIYSFEPYQTFVEITEIDPDDGDEGRISLSSLGDEDEHTIMCLCGPLMIPRYEGSDDEIEYDLTKPDPVKPPSGKVTVQTCFDALLLIDFVKPTGESKYRRTSECPDIFPAWSNADFEDARKRVEQWTQDERDAAYDYAVRAHFKASDNEDVYVPERPACLAQ
jgi:hypothetical protein